MASHSGIELRAIGRPFVFWDERELRSVLESAGFRKTGIFKHALVVQFPSTTNYITQQFEVGAATMPSFADIPEHEWFEIIATVNDDMGSTLAPYTSDDGTLEIPQPMNVIVAYR